MPRTQSVTVLSLHTSPLSQPGQGDAGGLNVFVLNSSRALARAGYDVHIFTRWPEDRSHSPEPGLTVHGVPAGGATPLSKEELRAVVPDFARRVQLHPDFNAAAPIHSHYWLSGEAARLLRRASGAPWIHTMHTTAARKAHHAGASEADMGRLAAETRIGAEADALTANTAADRRELVTDLGVAPGKVHVVSPGIDTEIFTPLGPAARWPVAAPGLRLLFAGRIQPYKGPQIALGAVAALQRRGLEASLVLIGERSGMDARDPEELARQAGIGDRVTALPAVPQAELASWYRAADLVLMPSRHETYGLVAAEALASGTPVVAHDVGGLSTLIRDDVDGMLVTSLDPERWADALEPLVRQGHAPQQWEREAAKTGSARGWDATARTLVALYSELSAAHSAPPAL
ncbi:glycosyltransferase [Galactobacter caseinivorans]|uniref:glycosyltransferase n=1 Tax=Galactobacter caseinivorans TaxID=2676123 RepID=UPI001314D5D4|nr:glycosyltransferase [Galactobacter caseinivorans]